MTDWHYWITLSSTLILYGMMIGLMRYLYVNTKAQKATLAKLDSLPDPILKDLNLFKGKIKKHKVKYMIGGVLQSAEEVTRGNTDTEDETPH